MPLIILCGLPSSGKTRRVGELIAFLSQVCAGFKKMVCAENLNQWVLQFIKDSVGKILGESVIVLRKDERKKGRYVGRKEGW